MTELVKKFLEERTEGTSIFSLKSLFYVYNLTQREFLDFDEKDKERIICKIEDNILRYQKSPKEFLANLAEQQKEMTFASNNILKIEFVDSDQSK